MAQFGRIPGFCYLDRCLVILFDDELYLTSQEKAPQIKGRYGFAKQRKRETDYFGFCRGSAGGGLSLGDMTQGYARSVGHCQGQPSTTRRPSVVGIATEVGVDV